MKESSSHDAHSREGEQKQLKPKSSASEKEKTKLRERHRRSITTKIFNGLRKYGGYNLPPRADINDVLRALANEAGWILSLMAPLTERREFLRHQGITVCLLCSKLLL